MTTRRSRFTALLAAAALTSTLVGAAVAPTVLAATPHSKNIGFTSSYSRSATWQGNTYAVGGRADPAVCDPHVNDPSPPDLICDHFFFTVAVDAAYWTTHNGGAEVTITWANSSDDFDLYVFDKDGNQVASSATGGGNVERAMVNEPDRAHSPYEVRVLPFLISSGSSDYKGVVGLSSTLATGPTVLPTRTPGGLAFGPATVVDAQRTEGEPLNFIDRNGAYWESGPFGTSTQQSFIHRSTDRGDSFHIVSAIGGQRPNLPPGGGDTDIAVDDQRVAYFTDLEALVGIDASVSNDLGNSWRKDPAANAGSAETAVDRQWFAVDNGTNTTPGTSPSAPNAAGAADNTVFLTYRQALLGSYIVSTPGSTGPLDPVGGLVYTNATDLAPTEPINVGAAPCGQLKFDPVKRNLYLACGDGDQVRVAVGHVNVGQRTGIHFTEYKTPKSPGGGGTSDVFPILTTDKGGNVYVVWVDENNHQVYYSASSTEGKTWTSAKLVNGNDSHSNTFPWAVGGAAGTLTVMWLGNASTIGGNEMPSFFNDRVAAAGFPWYGYVSVVQGATGSAPTFNQVRFTRKPMHYGQICNAGTLCLVTRGDRTMADYFSGKLDNDGRLRIVYNDTTSQHHGAHLFEARQLRGPNPGTGGTLNDPFPVNPMSDRTGDAQYPHYDPLTGPGPNMNPFDFTKLELSRLNQSTLRVRMTVVGPLADAVPPSGNGLVKTNSLWLTRFQAKSIGEGGETAYRIFYVGAEKTGPGAPDTFFAGSGMGATGPGNAIPGNGCVTNTPGNCKYVEYPREKTVPGTAVGNVITIDVPIQTGFGSGRPINGDILFNVTAFSFGRLETTGPPAPPLPVADFYTDVDATRSFDYSLVTNSAVGAPEDPVVLLSMSGPASAAPGSYATYRVTYRNLGPAASESAKIVDTLPDGVTFYSATRSGVYNSTTRTVTWSLGTVAANTTGYVDLKVKVASTTPAGTILVNRANFTGKLTISPPTAVASTLVK